MRITIDEQGAEKRAIETPGAEARPLWRRLLWLKGLWAAGVLSVGAVAMVLRWVLSPH